MRMRFGFGDVKNGHGVKLPKLKLCHSVTSCVANPSFEGVVDFDEIGDLLFSLSVL